MIYNLFNDTYLKTNLGCIINDKCENVSTQIKDKSIKLIYCDLPYNKTQNIWDGTISTDWLWKESHRILQDDGAIVLHGMEEFSAMLIMSNLKEYKYKWYWKKGNKPTGFLNAKKQPLRIIEDILVFYNKQCTYNPQMVKGKPCHSRGKIVDTYEGQTNNYGEYKAVNTDGDFKYPQTLLEFPRDNEKLHPTQKPLSLAEYIIKTYTNENDIIVDYTSGVCTSGLAAENLNRQWINIEQDIEYCKKAIKRFK